jgi:hypothetical protein
MRIVMTSLAVLALMACNRPAETATENVAEENVAADANAMVTPATFQLTDTTWELTRDGKAITETVDASGNYVAWSGAEHIDHGTAVMKDGKACFTSAMDKEGEVCWTTSPVEIGQSMDTTSDKGEKLSVKRVAFMAVPDNVKP